MIQDDANNASCPRCHFAYFSNATLNFDVGSTQ